MQRLLIKRRMAKCHRWLQIKHGQMLLFAIVLTLLSEAALAQTIKITGRVSNDTGEPMPRASITIKGTSNGTTADENGNYEISAPANGSLVFSSVGYVPLEVAVNSRTIINITLLADKIDAGSEVVVVGYGTQKKKDVTGAVVSVGEKALREVPVANLQQALIGRAAGLEIQSVGNQPGAGGQIRIRGVRSISGSNEPLVVVDGIPWDGTLNDINPGDIVSVDVLKDASATAIYGSRGANGVILVSTRKGQAGETRVAYNGFYGIGKPAYNYPVFNATEYQAMRNLSPWTGGYMPEELNGIELGRNTDWQDIMYQNARKTDHNITVSGGANGSTFSIGGGYYNETTVLPGEEYKRFTIRGAVDTRIGKKIKIGLNTQNSLGLNYGSQFVSGSAMFRLLAMSPLMPAYNEDGSIYAMPWGNLDDINSGNRYNPLYLYENKTWDDKVRRLRTFNTLYGEYAFLPELRYRINVGANYAQEFGGQFRAADHYPEGVPSYFRPALGNIARVNNSEQWGYTIENLLFWDKTIKDHKFNFTGLYSLQESQTVNSFAQKDSIDDDFVSYYNLALSTPINSSNTSIGGDETRSSLISYMGRLNYAFKNRYLLTLTYRRDGSSRLAKGNNWFDYPAISGGWIISDENFMDRYDWISTLKLRAGWGKTSNQSINPYQSLGLVNNSNGLPATGPIGSAGTYIKYNYGPTIVNGYNIISLPNPNLSWEFTNTLNLGLDFSFLKNRITGSIEYYDSKTDRILYGVNLPVTSGVAGSFVTNIGKMSNKGMEFSVSTVNIQSASGFQWASDLNLFFNRNKLLKLTDNIQQDIGSQLFVGHSMTALYDYRKLGIWQTSEAEEAAKFGAVPGQIKLADMDGNHIINADDRTIIGDMDADLQGGFTNRFSYKDFDLSVVMNARFGGTLVSQVHAPLAAYIANLDGRRNAVAVDYWTPTNPSNWFPMPSAATSTVSDGWRTLGYYDASYVRIRSINLGYTLNRNILNRIGANNVRFYFTLDNVALLYSPFWKQTGVDPQATAAGQRGEGDAYGNLRTNTNGNGALVITLGTPPRRTFLFGLNINF